MSFSGALRTTSADRAALAVAMVGLGDSQIVNGTSGTLRSNYHRPTAHFISRMQIYDTLNYLPDDIMTKGRPMFDGGTQAAGVTDHRLVEFVGRCPQNHRRSGTPKELLRSVLARCLPRRY